MADRHGLWRERLAKTTSSSVAGEHALSDCCPFYFIRARSFVSVPALVGALLVLVVKTGLMGGLLFCRSLGAVAEILGLGF